MVRLILPTGETLLDIRLTPLSSPSKTVATLDLRNILARGRRSELL